MYPFNTDPGINIWDGPIFTTSPAICHVYVKIEDSMKINLFALYHNLQILN